MHPSSVLVSLYPNVAASCSLHHSPQYAALATYCNNRDDARGWALAIDGWSKIVVETSRPSDAHQIFGIDKSFKVDLTVLEQSYQSLQKRLHPDLAGSKSQREREYSADQSAHVIQAYYILLRPLSRARYLLGLHGIRIEEVGTIEDPELLPEIMEINESISEISDAAEALKATEAENNGKIRLAYYVNVGEEILRKL
ncbi:unnamed protein product [Calypogeia fissa]